MISEMPKNNIGNLDKNKQDRINEIETYIHGYFEKYKVGYESSGIGCTQGTQLASAFWENLDDNWMKPIKDILQQKLIGKNLVDLGVGNDWRNIPSKLQIPIKNYIAVDIKLPSQAMLENCDILKDFESNKIKASFIEEDMLKYVARLPDNSSNFFLSAIDDDVILDDKYWKYLCEEIYRTTEQGGIVIDAGIGSIEYYLNKYAKDKFKIIYKENQSEGKKILEKNK